MLSARAMDRMMVFDGIETMAIEGIEMMAIDGIETPERESRHPAT